MAVISIARHWTSGSADAYVSLGVTYSVSSNNTTTTITIDGKASMTQNSAVGGTSAQATTVREARTAALAKGLTFNIKVYDPITASNITMATFTVKTGTTFASKTYTRNFTRQHTAKTNAAIFLQLTGATESRVTFTIPVKPSYTVAYNANGGTGTISNGTKWYGENLTLSSSKFTRTDFNQIGWSTSSTATTAQYAFGATYSANAAITLYAVWQRIYELPKITISKVFRCDSSGTAADEGKYAKILFSWSLYNVSGNSLQSLIFTVNGVNYNVYNSSPPSGLTGSGNIIVGNDALSTESSYPISATIKDTSQQGSGRSGTASASVPNAYYALDILSGGHGLGIGCPATQLETLDINLSTKIRGASTFTGAASFGNNVTITGTLTANTIKTADNTFNTGSSLGVAKGGTGRSTLTSNAILTGNGTSAINMVATANGACYATSANGGIGFGTLPIAQGGTGQTGRATSTTISNIATAASGFSITSASWSRWGSVAMLHLVVQRTGATSSLSNQTLVTLKSGLTPATPTLCWATTLGNMCLLDTSGAIRFTGTFSYTKNANFGIYGTYLL